ncbi:MAG TPA: PE-PPE domain-containing protein [Mycobacterium sp.]
MPRPTAAAAIALLSVPTAALAFGEDTALIMGGSGIPIPPPIYVDDVNDRYLHCDPPLCSTQPLATPEGLYPLVGVTVLPYDTSVAQGVTILNGAVQQQLAAGNDVTVLGWSQSTTIASLQMADILNGSAGIHPDPGQLNYVLVGDPNNANGGLLEPFRPAARLESVHREPGDDVQRRDPGHRLPDRHLHRGI